MAVRSLDAYTLTGSRVSAFDITGLVKDTDGYYTFGGAVIYGSTFYYTNSSGIRYKTGTAGAVPYGAETAVATNITDDISSLADGSVTLCAVGRDTAGNWQSTATTTTWTKDTAVPTISSGYYNDTTVTLVMSEPVYAATAPTATDFKVSDDGTAITVSAAAVAATADAASDIITLTVPSITAGSTVKAWYTKDATKPVEDAAGNDLASVASADALTITAAPTTTYTPSDGSYLTSLSGNVTIAFSSAVYSDSGCATALTNTTAGTITDLQQDDSDGTAIAHAATYDSTTHTITLDPSANLTEGDTVYASVTNGWYHNAGGSCAQGYASDATVTVDATAPTATLTGAPSGTNNTTTLSVTVGGTDVTHYKHFVLAGASCGTEAYHRAGSLANSTIIRDADGIANTDTHFYLVDSSSGTAARAYTLAGTRDSTKDITLAAENRDSTGAYADGTYLYVVDKTDRKIYAYNHATGAHDTSKEITLHADNADASGLAKSAANFMSLTRLTTKSTPTVPTEPAPRAKTAPAALPVIRKD